MTPRTDYRTILKNGFVERKNLNPQYSLRAYARDLGLTPGRLSKILNAKQGLSKASAKELAARLGLNETETEAFCSLVEAHDSRSRFDRAQAQARLATQFKEVYSILAEDEFRLISDWYHLALMDLAQLPGFKSDVKWIARRLGISQTEAETSIERLLRLRIFEKKGSKLICKSTDFATTQDVPSSSIKEFHKQILQKAIQALYSQSVEERDFSTYMVGIAPQFLPLFKTKIKKLREEVLRAQEKFHQGVKSKKEEVYCLSVQFFRLTKKDQE